MWYKREETNLRIAIFFSAATLSGAFGGLLAYGLSKMDGIGGRPGWVSQLVSSYLPAQRYANDSEN
jgi:hypothetical protein